MKNLINHLKAEWYKYLLEIIVITAGILGAFALNSWNEARVLRSERSHYIASLLDNLTKDGADLTQQVESAKTFEKHLDTLINMLIQPERFKMIEFLPRVHVAKMTPRFTNMPSTFENLNNSGKLNVIDNKDLVEKLFRYYHQIGRFKRGEDFAMLFSREQLIPLFNQLNSIILVAWLEDEEVELLYNRQDINEMQQDLTSLAKKSELLNHLITKRSSLNRQIEGMNELNFQVKELIKAIEIEAQKSN
jgi:Tfp pilus assembly protein PilE